MNELCFSCCINQCKRYVSEEYIFTKTSVRLSEVMYILRMIALIFFGAKSCRAKSCNTCFNAFFSSLAISFVDVIATMLSKLLPWRLKSDTSRHGHISEGAIYEWYKRIACSTVAAGGSLVSNSCKG